MDRRQFAKTTSLALAASPIFATPAPKPKIKIAQIGTAHAHASGKMEVYRNLPDDFEVVGIVEPDEKRWASASKNETYAGLNRLTIEDLLEVENLKAVAVETHVADLLDHAETCIDAGLHLHLDKPAGTSLPQFRRILEKADAKKLTVQMGYMYRFNPAVLLLHQFLKNGWLGDIFEVHAVMSKVVPPGGRKGLADFEGGIMFELGCHIIDLVVGVLGKPETITPHIRHHGDDGLADNMLAVFDYKNATATVRSTALEVEGFARRHLTVCGTGGTFHIQPLDRPTAQIALGRERTDARTTYKKGITEIPFEPPYRRYLGDALDFAKIIRGEKESDFPSTHDLAVQESLLRASGMPTV